MGYCTKEDKSIKIIVLFERKYYYAFHNEEIEITENEFLDLEKKDTIPIESAFIFRNI